MPWGGIMSIEKMPFTISDEVLAAAHISGPELKQELALTLFQQERLTLAQASHLAEMSQLAFQSVLAERQIPIHYGVQEFREVFGLSAGRNGFDRRIRHVASPLPQASPVRLQVFPAHKERAAEHCLLDGQILNVDGALSLRSL